MNSGYILLKEEELSGVVGGWIISSQLSDSFDSGLNFFGVSGDIQFLNSYPLADEPLLVPPGATPGPAPQLDTSGQGSVGQFQIKPAGDIQFVNSHKISPDT
jgi:hypothetical protein